MYVITESKSTIKADLKIIEDYIKSWNYRYKVDESDKDVGFKLESKDKAKMIYDSLKNNRYITDTWRIELNGLYITYDFR